MAAARGPPSRAVETSLTRAHHRARLPPLAACRGHGVGEGAPGRRDCARPVLQGVQLPRQPHPGRVPEAAKGGQQGVAAGRPGPAGARWNRGRWAPGLPISQGWAALDGTSVPNRGLRSQCRARSYARSLLGHMRCRAPVLRRQRSAAPAAGDGHCGRGHPRHHPPPARDRLPQRRHLHRPLCLGYVLRQLAWLCQRYWPALQWQTMRRCACGRHPCSPDRLFHAPASPACQTLPSPRVHVGLRR